MRGIWNGAGGAGCATGGTGTAGSGCGSAQADGLPSANEPTSPAVNTAVAILFIAFCGARTYVPCGI
ncbi:hypothetical protein MARA_36570 [Mycolicibacterium arabiense]|uniref:Lipoprotein n=1 Tax=Mycolicibacterium arabiense TaxID=1286181 RepID=A0A7I7S1U8_9MYCO|nr:hypothetical protein MARA_36570 [Mycolicibacterium arabiense]